MVKCKSKTRERAVGMLDPGSAAARVLVARANDAFRRADFTAVLSACMRRLVLAKGVSPERATLVHVWSRRSEVQPVAREDHLLAEQLGIAPGDFVVTHSGNAGSSPTSAGPSLKRPTGCDTSPVPASCSWGTARGGPRSRGSHASGLCRTWSTWTISLGTGCPSLSRSGDVHLASLRPEFEGIAVPAKLSGMMAAARPVLFLGPRNSETGSTVYEFRCGAVVDPRDEAENAGAGCSWNGTRCSPAAKRGRTS